MWAPVVQEQRTNPAAGAWQITHRLMEDEVERADVAQSLGHLFNTMTVFSVWRIPVGK